MLNVYLSHSYEDEDKEIFDFLKKVFSLPAIADRVPLNVYHSLSAPEARPVHEKVSRDILNADIVVAIFSKRHKIEGTDKFIPPLWVLEEVAYAKACQKRLLYFHEEGVNIRDLGFIVGEDLTSIEYSKSRIGQAELLDQIKSYVMSLVIDDQNIFSPTHVFRHFAKTTYVFPNGYGIVRYQLRLQPLKDIDSVSHHFFLEPENLKKGEVFDLPSLNRMNKNYDRFIKNRQPFPTGEVFSFASKDPELSWNSITKPDAKPNERWFEVLLPKGNAGRIFKYEWVWTSRNMHKINGKNSSIIGGGQAPISSCVFVLKILKQSPSKEHRPVLSLLNLLTNQPIGTIRAHNREVSNLYDIYVFKTTQAETQANLVRYELTW